MSNKSGKKRILFVEDEKPMAKVAQFKLEHEGCETVVAHDGKQALEALAKGSFDLIVTDLMMPGMDGFALLEAIKQQGLKTPVIVTTNLNQSEDEKRAKDLGATGYYVKSDVDIVDLVNLIKKHLA